MARMGLPFLDKPYLIPPTGKGPTPGKNWGGDERNAGPLQVDGDLQLGPASPEAGYIGSYWFRSPLREKRDRRLEHAPEESRQVDITCSRSEHERARKGKLARIEL